MHCLDSLYPIRKHDNTAVTVQKMFRGTLLLSVKFTLHLMLGMQFTRLFSMHAHSILLPCPYSTAFTRSCSQCSSQGYSAHVRIASQERVMMARDSDEVLSFGTFTSAEGLFEPHASLNAHSNGTLAVRAAGLDLLPGGGEATVGSGEQKTSAASCGVQKRHQQQLQQESDSLF